MTTPAGASGTEDIPLAQVNQLGVSEIMSALAMVASLLTVFFGKDFGIVQNARLIAELAVFLIPMATGFARAIKHHGVAHANALVTVAQIEAAARALIAAQQQATPGMPTPDSASATAPTPSAPTTITYGYSDGNPAAPGRHAAVENDLGLPVETVSTGL